MLNSNLKHFVGYGLALILIGLFLRFYIEEKEGRLKAEGEQKAVQARDEQQAKDSAHFEELIKGLKTPEQAKPLIQQALVSGGGQNFANKPFLTTRFDQLPPTLRTQLPNAPEAKPDATVGILTGDQIVALGKRELQCQKVEGELSTCQLDKQNMQNEINDLKGGTKWQKVVKEAKCLGFLGGGAALGGKLGGWKGAALGGIGGEMGCKIFF